MKELEKMKYYTINEAAARTAHESYSFRDYIPGSATEEYRRQVDAAYELARQQKAKVDSMYHEKIDYLADKYARKLAINRNERFSIQARVPSVMIAGPANFPVYKKERQNQALERNAAEYDRILHILDEISSTGTGGLSSDDPNVIQKLEAKLKQLEETQQMMKDANAYYRKRGTLHGFTSLSEAEARRLEEEIQSGFSPEKKPYWSHTLSSNSAEIRRVRKRLEALKNRPSFDGWEFSGGRVVLNQEINRLQVVFDGKPDEDVRAELKANGFRWAPSQNAWQRQYTRNAVTALNKIKAIQRNPEGEKD